MRRFNAGAAFASYALLTALLGRALLGRFGSSLPSDPGDPVLNTWILDLRSARQLGLTSTGHAARGTSSPPSPSTSNLYLAPGTVSPAALMADIKSGFLVTELIGMSLNSVTGDYSRGAVGFWIEDGAIAYPVSEVTIAGNVIDMFAHLSAADDLEFRHGVDAPTLRVDGMTVAGR